MISNDAATKTEQRPGIDCQLTDLLETAASLVARLLDADLGGVTEVVDSGTALRMTVSPTDDGDWDDGRAVEEMPLETSKSMAGHAINKGNTVLVSDLAADNRFSEEFLQQQGVVSAMTVPVQLIDKPLGTLAAYRTEQREFTADDARFVEAIGQLLSSLVARFSAEEVLKERRSATGNRGVLQSVEIALAGGVGTEASPEAGDEYRTSPRHGYEHGQLVARMLNGRLPAPADFFEVDCRDLSAGGVSFYLDSPPDFDTLVVALGRRSALSHFAARVAHVAKVQHANRQQYLIGCQFTERVYI